MLLVGFELGLKEGEEGSVVLIGYREMFWKWGVRVVLIVNE